MNQEQFIAYLEDVRDEWDAVDKLTKAVDALKDAHSRTAELEHHIETIEHGWSSALSSPHRWATEPIPFPRRRNDVYRIQTDYMRSIECSGSGPTAEERAEKVNQLVRDAMDLTYEVMHLRMTVQTARATIAALTEEKS